MSKATGVGTRSVLFLCKLSYLAHFLSDSVIALRLSACELQFRVLFVCILTVTRLKRVMCVCIIMYIKYRIRGVSRIDRFNRVHDIRSTVSFHHGIVNDKIIPVVITDAILCNGLPKIPLDRLAICIEISQKLLILDVRGHGQGALPTLTVVGGPRNDSSSHSDGPPINAALLESSFDLHGGATE